MSKKLLFPFLVLLLFSSSKAQSLLNGGFEEAVSTDGETTPKGWTFDHTGGKYGENAHTGKRALTINNWYFWAQGWACYGAATGSFDCAGQPVDFNPAALRGWYQYAYGDNQGDADSAVCLITVYSHRDTIAHVRALLPRSEKFAPFNVPIQYRKPGAVADTIAILFISSVGGKCGGRSGGNCLHLTVDDLELATEAVATPPVPDNVVELIQALDKKSVNITAQQPLAYPIQLKIHDGQGVVILQETIKKPSPRGIACMAKPGMYSWQIEAQDGTLFMGFLRIQ